MDSVLSLSKAVVVLTFVWTFAECILPDSKYKKHTDFVYGLVLTATVAGFILNFDFKMPDISSNFEYGAYRQDYVKGLYETELEKTLRQKFGDESVDVELNGDFEVESIKCADGETYKMIKEYLYGN